MKVKEKLAVEKSQTKRGTGLRAKMIAGILIPLIAILTAIGIFLQVEIITIVETLKSEEISAQVDTAADDTVECTDGNNGDHGGLAEDVHDVIHRHKLVRYKGHYHCQYNNCINNGMVIQPTFDSGNCSASAAFLYCVANTLNSLLVFRVWYMIWETSVRV